MQRLKLACSQMVCKIVNHMSRNFAEQDHWATSQTWSDTFREGLLKVFRGSDLGRGGGGGLAAKALKIFCFIVSNRHACESKGDGTQRNGRD